MLFLERRKKPSPICKLAASLTHLDNDRLRLNLLTMKTLLLSIILTLVTVTSFSQAQFNFRYGSPLYDRARKTIQTKDGNYIVIGTTNGFGSAGNAFMMKVGANGNILWLKDYTGINEEEAHDVIELSNGNLVLCGATRSYGAGSIDAFVMETDDAGNMLWAKAYGNIYGEIFYRILPISKSEGDGFYVTGFAQKVPGHTEGTVLLKLDASGNILWNKWISAFCGVGDYFNLDLIAISSGGVLLTSSACGTSILSWKFSPSGNLVWSNKYTAVFGGFSQGMSILEDIVGDIYFCSNLNDAFASVDIAVLKLQSNGNIVWLKKYGGTYADWGKSISTTKDGGLIISGKSNSAGNGDYDACLIKLDQSGSVQWAKEYGTVWYNIPANAVQTTDNGYIMTGQTFSFGTTMDSSKVWLVKTDSVGQSSCHSISWTPNQGTDSVSVTTTLIPDTINLQVNSITWTVNPRSFYEFNECSPTEIDWITANESFNVYPNPFSTQITFSLADNEPTTTSLYNFLGQQVLKQTFTNSTTINTEQLADGIYFYELRNEKGAAKNGKVLKQ